MSEDRKDTISFRLPTSQRQAIDALAVATERHRSELISDAIRAYLDVQQWQIAEIQQAIKEADAGMFASEEEVEKLFAELTK